MSTSEKLQGQRYSFQTDTAQGTYNYTVRVDNLYATNDLYVESISTPQGPFIENIPIPEEVVRDMVTAMDSILGVNQPTITLSGSTFTFEATEGGCNPTHQDFQVENTGDFGSLLDAVTTASHTWLTTIPSEVGNISKDELGDFVLQPMTGSLTATNSPYTGTITVSDPRATNTPQTLNVTFNVLPKPLLGITPTTVMTFNTFFGVTPPSQLFLVANSGPALSKLNWTAQVVNASNWLSVNPTTGGPLLNSDIPVVSNVNIDVTGVSVGSYVDIIRFSDTLAGNTPVDVEVRLTVVAEPG
jgi:hypothetical protein